MRYIESYVHNDGRIGVLLELEAGDESARENDEFRSLARNLVLQVAGCKAESPRELLDQPFIKDPEQLVSHSDLRCFDIAQDTHPDYSFRAV